LAKQTIINADYLDWQSELSLEQVFAGTELFAYPHCYADAVIYLTQLKHENSRSVLMLKKGKQTVCITPNGFSLRSKISEYGGKPFWLYGTQLYFVNQNDQCLYRQTLFDIDEMLVNDLSKPQRITPKPSTRTLLMYSDVTPIDDHTLVMIVEQENPAERTTENISYVASIDLRYPDRLPVMLQSGADFYSNLVVDQVRQRLAWVEWQHPMMPWDNTELFYGAYVVDEAVPNITRAQQVDLGAPACVCQLLFANNGRLFFSADFTKQSAKQNFERKGETHSDYWNVFCYDFEQQRVSRITNLSLEFGYPHWQYGDARVVQFLEDKIIVIGSAPQGDCLFEIDQNSFDVRELVQSDTTIQNLASDGFGRIAMVRLNMTENPSLLVLENQVVCEQGDSSRPVALAATTSLTERIEIQHSVDIDAVSVAEHVTVAAADGESIYGYYYPPTNQAYECASAPPLIVLVHGGPTARAYGHFDIQKQFWTSRGFALFDVNHRGSTGYGRAYRDALYGQWGELDTGDIISGIAALVEQGKADAERVCIRGKSAGGYAVLRALTEYPEVFKAGACYYGIGNLATLAEATHKFEKYYTDRLIDEAYEPKTASLPSSNFYQRSPIHKISNLKSAMIIFQGLQDKVVPPKVAREVVAALQAAGLEHLYVEYADEGHGFRQVDNNIDAWGKELAFYQQVLAH